MAEQPTELSVSEVAEMAGVHPNTVRRMVDNYLADQAGQKRPYPGTGTLQGRLLATGRGPSRGAGRGRVRRVNRDAALRLAAQQQPPPEQPEAPPEPHV